MARQSDQPAERPRRRKKGRSGKPARGYWILGGAIGALLAGWSLRLLIAFNADHIPRLNETRLDGRSLAFTMLVAGLTGLLFGLAPAWQSTKPDLNVALKDSGGGATSGLRRRRPCTR